MGLIAKTPSRFTSAVKLVCDGGCRGNPGPGAIAGFILDNSNNELHRYSSCIGQTTNNRAEYHSLIKGLDACAKFTRGEVTCFLDSEVVVKQMIGEFRLRSNELRALFHETKQLESAFRKVVYQHVKRTHPLMKKADRMVNEAFEGRFAQSPNNSLKA